MSRSMNEGANDSEAILVGPWQEVIAWADPAGTPAAKYIGTTKDGLLTISQEFYSHMDSSWPRQLDVIIPTSLRLTFTCNLDEVNRQNFALAVGKDFATPDEYMYFGNLVTPTYFSLELTRRRVSDGQYLEVFFYKSRAFGDVTLGDADEAVPVPFQCEALSDQDGTYGSTAQGRVAWVRVPSGP